MRVALFGNKCRIRESDLQAACLYIIFLNGETVFKTACSQMPRQYTTVYGIKQLAVYRFIVWRLLSGY